MNIASIPAPLLIAVLLSVVIPAVSALVTRLRWDSSITGLITLAMSGATGFVTEWGSAGAGFDWKAAAVTAAGSWLVAAVSQSKILSGTGLEARLLAFRSGPTVGPGEPDPTVGLDPSAAAPPVDVPVDPTPAPVVPEVSPVPVTP